MRHSQTARRRARWILLLAALLLALWPLLFLAAARVSIRLQEHSRVITCIVPPHADNRALHMGVVDHFVSSQELHGAAAPSTHQVRFRDADVRCATEDETLVLAFCELVSAPNERAVVTAQLLCVQ